VGLYVDTSVGLYVDTSTTSSRRSRFFEPLVSLPRGLYGCSLRTRGTEKSKLRAVANGCSGPEDLVRLAGVAVASGGGCPLEAGITTPRVRCYRPYGVYITYPFRCGGLSCIEDLVLLRS
jgi:hypothetical protein